jgi:hypothetical protein
MTNLTMGRWMEDTIDHLNAMERADGRLSHICSMHHGFESWLKFEMAAVLCRKPWNYQRWIGAKPGDVGLEYRAVLAGRETKLIDLWAAPFRTNSKRTAKSWHFVELKVAFNNANAAKQFASWRADFDLLRTMDLRRRDQKALSLASVMFGFGFDTEEFRTASSRACERLGVQPVMHEVPTALGSLLIHVLADAVA